MYNMTFDIKGIQYKRVSKPMARKAYNEGKKILLCPCKLMPGGVWNHGIAVTNATGRTFDRTANEFEYYNCNAEAGYYAAFYIEA